MPPSTKPKRTSNIEHRTSNIEQNIANAEELFQSKLNQIFSQKGEGWVETTLGDVCETITKGSSPKWQGVRYVGSPGVLFITSENVGSGELLMNKRKYVETEFNIIEPKSILKRGDVLSNIVGASIGRTAVFTLDEIANINQAVCLIRCKPERLMNSFLSHLLNSPFFKDILHDNEVNMARANLSLTFFRELPVPIPSLDKQKVVVKKIDAISIEVRRIESHYERKLASLDELKKSILQKAFAGGLT
ncbi:MAG: restriction endonuclease subunit S [Luteolibacter sp.]